MALELIYETHATTVDNERGVATGWQPGELSAAGRRNAEDLGRRRRTTTDLVITSDLARAVQTVDVAFSGSAVPVRQDVRLREVDYGELTGAPVAEIERQRVDHVEVPWPGGQSYREVAAGVDELLDELVTDHDGSRVLLVGHAATRFALAHLLTGRPLERAVAGPFRWREGWTWTLTATRPTGDVLDAAAVRSCAEEIVDVYRAAFQDPGYDESGEQVDRFAAEQLPKHLARQGFRCATIHAAGRLVAFAYGYVGGPGQWWTDQVTAAAPRDVADAWLTGGHFEVVEVAVRPELQGHGFGAAVHDLLLLDAPGDRALLTATVDPNKPAPRLYQALGWRRLAQQVFEDSDLYGLDLKAWRSG